VEPKTRSGIDKARPRRINSFDPLAAAATAIIRVGHDDDTDGGPQRVGRRDLFLTLFRAGEPDPDPQQENAARDLHERQAQQFNNKNGEDDAQGDRRAGAEHDAQCPLSIGQRTAGKRNDHGIVPREKNINPDNLEKREPKRRRDRVHGLELGHGQRGVKLLPLPLPLHKIVVRGHCIAIFREIVTEFLRDGQDRDNGGADYVAATWALASRCLLRPIGPRELRHMNEARASV
jgi:hypothetical protein